MLYLFPGGDELAFNDNSLTTEEFINSMIFCTECILGGMQESAKHLLLTVTMHGSFYFAVCSTLIHLALIIHVSNISNVKLTALKSAIISCTFIFSIFGYIMTAGASVVIKEEPAFFMLYDLSLIIGTFQLFVYILWIIGMISIVKGDDDEIFDADGETTFV